MIKIIQAHDSKYYILPLLSKNDFKYCTLTSFKHKNLKLLLPKQQPKLLKDKYETKLFQKFKINKLPVEIISDILLYVACVREYKSVCQLWNNIIPYDHYINDLSNEIIIHIFSFMNNLRCLKDVCRRWYTIIKDNKLYLSKFFLRYTNIDFYLYPQIYSYMCMGMGGLRYFN